VLKELPFFRLSCLLLACVVAPVHAEDRFSALSLCAENASHAEQRECLEQMMKVSVASLGAAQKGLMNKLRGVDQEAAEKQRAISAAQADAAAFVAYAGKHCEAFASLAYGGNSQQDRRLACQIELNSAREQQVNKIAASLR